MDEALAELEAAGIRWGIVTDKMARFTVPLVRALWQCRSAPRAS